MPGRIAWHTPSGDKRPERGRQRENLGQGLDRHGTGSGAGFSSGSGALPTYFLFLAVGDALLLGLGVSFLLFGFPVMRQVSPDSKLRAWAMYLSIGYLMVSWWPHLNLHSHNGIDLQGLLYIDYFFHLPLEIAGVVLALSFISLVTGRTAEEPEPVQEASERGPLADGGPAVAPEGR